MTPNVSLNCYLHAFLILRHSPLRFDRSIRPWHRMLTVAPHALCASLLTPDGSGRDLGLFLATEHTVI